MSLDLLDNADPLLKELPAEFLKAFHPGHAGRRIAPWLLKQQGTARLAVAQWLGEGWHKLFGDCRVINTERFAAVCRCLDNGLTPREIAWAIAAYHKDCTTAPGRIKTPTMRRSFLSFLQDAVETWAAVGADLRARTHGTTARRAREVRTDAILARFRALPHEEQYRLQMQAFAKLDAAGVDYKSVLNDPHVSSVLETLLSERPPQGGAT